MELGKEEGEEKEHFDQIVRPPQTIYTRSSRDAPHAGVSAQVCVVFGFVSHLLSACPVELSLAVQLCVSGGVDAA